MIRTKTTEISTNETERLGERIVNLLSQLDLKYEFTGEEHNELLEAVQKPEEKAKQNEKQLDLLLFCPNCGKQHIDKAEPNVCQDCGHDRNEHFNAGERNVCSGGWRGNSGCQCDGFTAWLNPPHKSHRCDNCNHVWRPADVPTNGVAVIKTRGKQDKSAIPQVTDNELRKELEYLTNLINTPHTNDFLEAVPLEAAHQITRWGVEHDAGKEPTDWLWLIGYLAGKATNAAINKDLEKAKHHTISTAGVCLNWFRRLVGDEKTFRPGIDPKTLEGK
jgi:hypothetical protein